MKKNYFSRASDYHREKQANAPFIQAGPVNYWPLILFFAAFILAGWNF